VQSCIARIESAKRALGLHDLLLSVLADKRNDRKKAVRKPRAKGVEPSRRSNRIADIVDKPDYTEADMSEKTRCTSSKSVDCSTVSTADKVEQLKVDKYDEMIKLLVDDLQIDNSPVRRATDMLDKGLTAGMLIDLADEPEELASLVENFLRPADIASLRLFKKRRAQTGKGEKRDRYKGALRCQSQKTT
jgi:hypothetical protein